MSQIRAKLWSLGLGFIFCLKSGCVLALPNDKNEKMQLWADSANLDQSLHEGHYLGHVSFTQGSTNLRAAKALTRADAKNQLILAEALGDEKEQAHFWTQPEADKPVLHAYADVIHYYPQKHQIVLLGHAKIQQGENSMAAPEMIYDTEKQNLLSKNKGQDRTVIILYPEKKTS